MVWLSFMHYEEKSVPCKNSTTLTETPAIAFTKGLGLVVPLIVPSVGLAATVIGAFRPARKSRKRGQRLARARSSGSYFCRSGKEAHVKLDQRTRYWTRSALQLLSKTAFRVSHCDRLASLFWRVHEE